MKPNPGGQLAPQDIVGRDALIQDLKDVLEQQSVLLVAERRVGKTHVLEKFKTMAPARWVIVKRDLESVRSGREFVECTMADLYPHLETKTNLRQSLVQRLLTDSQLQIEQVEHPDLYARTAQAVDCMPYYIHHVAAALVRTHRGRSEKLDWAAVSATITQSIQAPHDPWNLQHYEERTQEYYGTQRPQSLALLDALASSAEPLSMTDAIRRTRGTHPNVEPQEWQDLIRLLQRDHYLVRDDDGNLAFKFGVVKRWWVWHRGLPNPAQGRQA